MAGTAIGMVAVSSKPLRRFAALTRITNSSGNLWPVPAMLCVLLVTPAWAAKWDVVPSLSAEETYTDNVRLTPGTAARSDWVTKITPAVSARGNGDRMHLNVAYTPQLLYRTQEGTEEIVHLLNASGDAVLVRNLLFIDSRAAITQQNISMLGPLSDNNVNNTGNRTSVKTFSVSPYFRHSFGSAVQGEARLTFNTVGTGAAIGTSSRSQSNRVDVKLASGPAYKLLTWNIAYSKDHLDSGQPGVRPVDTGKISAGAVRMVTPQFGLRINAGYEESNYLRVGAAPQGMFWSVGPEWSPTPRTRVAATVGRRYLGSTRSFDFSHRTRLTTWGANYSEDITTTHAQSLVPQAFSTAGYLDTLFLSSIPDTQTRQGAIQSFIERNGLPENMVLPVSFLTTTTFLTKNLRGTFGIQGVRNTILANVFTQNREADSVGAPGAAEFALGSRTRQTGASLLWTLRITPQTASNFGIGVTRNQVPALGRVDDQKYIRLGITRQLQPRLSGTVSYRWLHNTSSQGGTGYDENAVVAAIKLGY